MSKLEARVNQQLRLLDTDFRGGRVAMEDYRRQRRHMLASLLDGAEVTARNALCRPAAPGAPRRAGLARSPTLDDMAVAPLPREWWSSARRLALLAALALGGWLVYRYGRGG